MWDERSSLNHICRLEMLLGLAFLPAMAAALVAVDVDVTDFSDGSGVTSAVAAVPVAVCSFVRSFACSLSVVGQFCSCFPFATV